MRKRRVRRLPVVDARGALIGVLTLGDLVRNAAKGSDKAERDATLATLAAIYEPRPATHWHRHFEPTDLERLVARQADLDC